MKQTNHKLLNGTIKFKFSKLAKTKLNTNDTKKKKSEHDK